MKRHLITLLLFVLPLSVFCQKVDSVRVEQTGDLIKIHYKILNSTQFQTFRITLFCSINDGLESVPRSLSGDVGENVTGGRSEYLILWDVLKDVDEVRSVDFSVRSELISDNTPKSRGKLDKSNSAYWQKERFFILASGGIGSDYFLWGGRLGFMGKWGFAFGALAGTKPYPVGGSHDGQTYESTAGCFALTKRIVNNNNFQLHILGGIAISDHASTALTQYQGSMRWGPDLGLVAGINRLALYAGFSKVKPSFFSDLESEGTSWFDIGIGVRF